MRVSSPITSYSSWACEHKMLTRDESGLYRPRTIEENQEVMMHILNAPLLDADYVSSISQVLSPRRPTELRDLARIIRDTAEPHVQTAIPNDLRVRPHRSADNYPHIQAGLKVELMYAYALLQATENSERRNEYLEEAARLEEDIQKDLAAKKFFIGAFLNYTLRGATLRYFGAAWNTLNDGDKRTTEAFIDESLLFYQQTKEGIKDFQSSEKQYAEIVRSHGVRDIFERAQLLFDKKDTLKSLQGMEADKGGIEEFLIMLATNQFGSLLQDVLFGEMRCYALQGNYRMLTKTAQEFREFTKNPENKPAPVITESATIINYDADKNKIPDDLIHTPFISDSPPIVLEAVESIKNSFGKVSSKLWQPGDRESGIPLIL